MKVHRKQKGKMTKHHLRPASRRGTNKKSNIVKLPQYEHSAYHRLFGNLTPAESIQFLETILQGGKTWTGGRLRDLREDIMGGYHASF